MSDEGAVSTAVGEALSVHTGEPGALLPVLHAIQDALGYVPPQALPTVAHALNLSRAEVAGVVSFYHDFRTAPPGRRVVKICCAEACQAMGADALVAHAEKTLGVGMGSTRADGAITLEPVYCLGNCSCAPAVLVDGELYGRVSSARLDDLARAAPPGDRP